MKHGQGIDVNKRESGVNNDICYNKNLKLLWHLIIKKLFSSKETRIYIGIILEIAIR